MELVATGGGGIFPVGSGAVGYENGMKHQFSSVESWAQVCEETQRCMLESAWKEAARIVNVRREKDQLDDLETMTLFSGLGTDVHFSGDESTMQWRTTSNCRMQWSGRMVIGLMTSRIVAAIQICGTFILCKDSTANLSFVKRSLCYSVRTLKEVIQCQKDDVISLGIEFSVKHPLFASLCEERRAEKRESATSSFDASGQRRHRQFLGRLLWLKRYDLNLRELIAAETILDRNGMIAFGRIRERFWQFRGA